VPLYFSRIMQECNCREQGPHPNPAAFGGTPSPLPPGGRGEGAGGRGEGTPTPGAPPPDRPTSASAHRRPHPPGPLLRQAGEVRLEVAVQNLQEHPRQRAQFLRRAPGPGHPLRQRAEFLPARPPFPGGPHRLPNPLLH
jgi:hypothetical protein